MFEYLLSLKKDFFFGLNFSVGNNIETAHFHLKTVILGVFCTAHHFDI